MTTFKTADGKEYSIAINVGAIERVKSYLGINLANPLMPFGPLPPGQFAGIDVLQALWGDLALFGKALWLLFPKKQRDSLDHEEFLEQLDGPSVAAAFTAFREEWESFFRSRSEPEVASFLNRLWAMLQERSQLAAEEAKNTDLRAEFEKAKARASQPTGFPSPTSGPESPESPILAA